MTRIVVVGNGMAGSRVVDELLRRDPALQITVFGAEAQPAYNRILLSDVLAGKRSHAEIALVERAGPVRHVGVAVAGIDRAARAVTAVDGTVVAYDHLVLATGSTAVIPPVHGIAGPSGLLLKGVFVFRTLADCVAITEAAGRAKRAVVVGGGLLGLEAARGLLQRGLSVDVVHGADRLMDVQLDARGGAVLRRAVEGLGVGVHTGSYASRVTGTRKVTGVGLADGRQVPGDLVVLACGVRPEVALARSAGLTVARGIVVDDVMRTSDPAVSAIGECAQHDGQVYGLVAPAWEQAAVLAAVLTGRSERYAGSRLVTRLKALGLEVAAMGDTTASLDDVEDGLEVLVFADPARHVYKKLVLRCDILVGALLLGDLSTAGAVTQAFDRGAPLPPDRTHLLFAPRRSAAPTDLADDDVVCTCNAVTAGALRASGCRTLAEAALSTRATTGCGTCAHTVAGLLRQPTLQKEPA